MNLSGKSALQFFLSSIFLFSLTVFADQSTLQEDLNNYFVEFDAAFAKIVEAGAVRSTSLRPAERLFVREMRKNLAYNTFYRTNSKGVIISEAVRGQTVERPMRDVSDQRWFRKVSTNKEAYYTLINDKERGRYYLFWARPVLKRGDRFVGTVVVKIDLWDSFYEFSNSIYFPFLIKLGRKSLFSHKWNEGASGIEKALTIQGVDRISVIYSGEEKKAEPVVEKKDTAATFAVVDSAKKDTAVAAPEKKKKGGSGLLIFLLVVLVIGIAAASFMLIAWMRRRAFLKRLDEEDDI